MGELLLWWLAAEVLGVLALPFAATVFARLPDRGWALARPLGLLLWGWLIWFPFSLVTALPYSRAAVFVMLIVFAALAFWRFRAMWPELTAFARRQWRYLLASETVFTGAFALMAWYRTFLPAVVDQEKYMDEAFLAAFWRAPHLPAPDPWLAGSPINYYYFGHYLMGTLAKLLATPPPVAFNTAIILTFALAASAIFGLVANLVAARGGRGPEGPAHDTGGLERPFGTSDRAPAFQGREGQSGRAPAFQGREGRSLGRAAGWGAAGAVLMLVLGNLAGARTWWADAVAAAQQQPAVLHNSPWAWWTHPLLWLTYDWWTPSRAVPNTITEFPAFSFILSDLHAHVLALPFAAVAVALALNLLLARGLGLRAFGDRWSGILALAISAIILGALYAINGWDLPTYLGLCLLALGIAQWIEHGGLSGTFLLNWFACGAMLTALAVLAYIPFYRGFVSPAQGIGYVPPAARTLIGDEFAMFGLPAVLVGTLLVLRLVRMLRNSPPWSALPSPVGEGSGVRSAGGQAPLPQPLRATAGRPYMAERGVRSPFPSQREGGWGGRNSDTATLVPAVLVGACLALLVLGTLQTPTGRDWTLVWSLALLAGCALVAWHALGATTNDAPNDAPIVGRAPDAMPAARQISVRADLFLWCAAGTAFALMAASEVLYLRDAFDGGDLFRMNTVFKLDYQAWLLLGTAAAAALAELAPLALGRLAELIEALVAVIERLTGAAPASLADAHADTSLALAAAGRASTAARTHVSAFHEHDTDSSQPAEAGFVAERLGAGLPARDDSDAVRATTHPSAAPTPLPVGEGSGVRSAPLRPVALRWLGLSGTLLWGAALVALFAAAAIYPIQAAAARTSDFTGTHSLDGTAYLATDPLAAGDPAAIAWLNDPAHVSGDPVILEAVSATEGDYTHYARISANTGLPTLMGWVGHEYQWRPADGAEISAHVADAQTIYTSHDPSVVRALLARYNVSYIYVGAMERDRYPGVNMDQFTAFLRVVYRADGVTIYQVR